MTSNPGALMRVALAAALLITSAAPAADDDEKIAKLTKDLTAKTEKTRVAALEVLGGMGAAAAPATKAVCDRLTDPSPNVALAALAAVEKIDPALHKPLSVVLLEGRAKGGKKGKDDGSFGRAVDQLAAMGEKARPASRVLIARLQAEVQGGGPVYMLRPVLAIAPDDAESIQMLKAVAGPANRSGFGRVDVLSYLAKWAGDDEDRRKELVPLVKVGLSDPKSAAACCAVAGDLGKSAADLLPLLKELKLSKTAAIRDAAAAAVKKIEG